MTTPTNPTNQPTPAQQAAEQFRAELRADLAEIMDELHSQRAELTNIRADIESMRDGLTQAASKPAPASGGATQKFIATRIEKETRKNKNYYRVFGPAYPKFGITIWDEVFESLGLDLKTMTWKDDYIYILTPPMEVIGTTETYKDKETGEIKTGVGKVIGKA